VKQQPERSGAHETDEGGRITSGRVFENFRFLIKKSLIKDLFI